MTQAVVALLGISGVGKSTLLRKLSESLKFQQLQASALIKEGRQIAEDVPIELDTLRSADIDKNQQFLTSGFLRAVDPNSEIIILDGHSVIDTPTGLVSINSSVFSKIGITSVIVLADNPNQINLRRAGDISRNRPVRDLNELCRYQDLSILNAVTICRELLVPLIIVTPAQHDYILQSLKALLN